MVKAGFDHVGKKIREERRRIGLTLEELAKATGVSTSYISLVENAKAVPSLKILDKICSRLSIHMSTLFADGEPAKECPYAIFRRRSQVVVTLSEQRKLTVLLPKTGVPMEPVHLEILPGDLHSSPTTHKGMEFGYVIAGQVEFSIANQTKSTCNQGDSLIYDAMQPHLFSNRGKAPAELLLVALPHHKWTGEM